MAVIAHADEGGVPFWFSGQFSSISAVSPTPGWSMVLTPYVALAWGASTSSATANVALRNSTLQANQTDSMSGGTDLFPYASLSWNKGNDNWMTYLTGAVPVGAYSVTNLASIGIGHAAMV